MAFKQEIPWCPITEPEDFTEPTYLVEGVIAHPLLIIWEYEGWFLGNGK